jgi:hypothetical protein
MGCIPYFGAFLPYFDGLSAGLKPVDLGRNLLLPAFRAGFGSRCSLASFTAPSPFVVFIFPLGL